jgi:hypothetical protein
MPIDFFSTHPTVPILLIGTVVAVVSLRSQRHLARAKNTLDFDRDFKEKEMHALQAAHRLMREMPFIDQRQRNNPRYYNNFCWLGTRWAALRTFYAVPAASALAPQRILRVPIYERVTRHAEHS